MLNFVDEGDYFTDLWDEEWVDSEIQPPHFEKGFKLLVCWGVYVVSRGYSCYGYFVGFNNNCF